MDSEKCCGTCMFWKQAQDKRGLCRRHSPMCLEVIAQGIGVRGPVQQKQVVSVFPPMDYGMWCGDYRECEEKSFDNPDAA